MMVAIHTTTLIIKLVIINKHKDGIGSEIVGKSSDIMVRKTVSANKVVVTYGTHLPDSTGNINTCKFRTIITRTGKIMLNVKNKDFRFNVILNSIILL